MSLYTANMSGQPTTDQDDFFRLKGAAGVLCKVKEIRVWQTGSTTLAMNGVQFVRGTSGGTGGTALDEYKMDITSVAASATAFRLPTADVATTDLTVKVGWNILQEMVWLATPELEITLGATQILGVRLLVGASLTGAGLNIIWEERSS